MHCKHRGSASKIQDSNLREGANSPHPFRCRGAERCDLAGAKGLRLAAWVGCCLHILGGSHPIFTGDLSRNLVWTIFGALRQFGWYPMS